ncbi:MAG TPA: hypothetical protein VFP58_12975 [Candidatus Eisenbacteria bacterium]|nr:hypothetical protein [Candidatus Eisenbacteria bacterium]
MEILEASMMRLARGRGRPALMRPDAVLDKIRRIASENGLYRVHRTHSSLYARARRQFGSWEGAVKAAGIDYREALTVARRRSLETRRRLRRQRIREHP